MVEGMGHGADPFLPEGGDPPETLSEAELWEGVYLTWRQDAKISKASCELHEQAKWTNRRQHELLAEADQVRKRQRELLDELRRRAEEGR